MKYFLEDIAQHYSGLQDLEHYCFVLPSKRAGNFLRNYLKDSMSSTVFAPKITSIEVFVSELANTAYLSEEQQLFRLYEIYKSGAPDPLDSFADFCGWASTLLIDFSEIDQYLVDAQKLFSYLEDYKKLSEWNPTDAPNELLSSYVKFWKSLYPMYEQFKDSLSQDQLGTRGMIYRKAVEEVDHYLEKHPNTKFVFVGFNALNKAEELLFQHFLECGRAKVYWDIDSYILNDQHHDAGYFIRSYQEQWKQLQELPLEGISSELGKPKEIQIIGLPMQVAQGQYVGALLSTMNQETLKNTALILGKEESLNIVLNALPKELTPNITMGYALKNSKVSGFVELLFDIHTTATSDRYRATDVFKILLHPLFKSFYSKEVGSSTDALVFAMRKRNLSYWNTSELEKIKPEAAALFETVFSKDLQSPKKFVKQAFALVEQFQKIAKEHRDSALETDCIYISGLLKKLQSWMDQYDFIDSLVALNTLFQRMLSKTNNYFKGEALEGLQIMGMLESRNLDFETVILTHLNEGILPGGKKMNSHLPYELKKMYGLPTYKERDAVFTYHFYRLLQRCKNAYLIYNIEPEVIEGGEPSRYIAQLETDDILSTRVQKKIVSPQLNTQVNPPLSIIKSNEDIQLIKKKFEDLTSPSALITYLWNPIDFYHSYILKIKETPELNTQMPHYVFGSIVHDSLEELYKGFVGKVLVVEDLKGLYPRVQEVVNRFYEHYFVPLDQNSGKNIIAYEVIVSYVNRYIRSDIELSKKQDIKLIALEEEYRMPLELPSLSMTINCQGKFDRVEERNGVLTIIDYKTGLVKSGELKMNSWEALSMDYKYSKQLQLLFYSMIYMNQYGLDELQAGIYSFKNMREGLMLFKEDKSTIINQNTIAQFKEQLTRLIAEIIDSNQAFLEKEPPK